MRRTAPVTMPYSEIRPLLQTGDIVLFAGTRPFSRLIQTLTRSPWSHVAMIVRDGEAVLCWESGNKDVIQHDFATEYRLSVALRMAQASGEQVTIRRLYCDRTEAMLAAYQAFRKEVEGRPYERDKLELLKAVLGVPLTPKDLSSLFCSELIAETYQRMGLLTYECDSNWYSPKDFSSQGAAEIINGSLGDEVHIQGPD